MYQEYVPVYSITSALQTYENNIKKRGGVPRDIWKEILASRETNSYLIVEERQLTHILIESLHMVLPSHLVVGDSSLLTRVDYKICEFAISLPVIIICSTNSAATVGTYVDIKNNVDIDTEDDLGLTIEAKQNEFELGQTIAKMIRVAPDFKCNCHQKKKLYPKGYCLWYSSKLSPWTR